MPFRGSLRADSARAHWAKPCCVNASASRGQSGVTALRAVQLQQTDIIRLGSGLALRYLGFVDGLLEPLQTDLRMDLDRLKGYERNH